MARKPNTCLDTARIAFGAGLFAWAVAALDTGIATAATFSVTDNGALCNASAVSGGGADDTAAFNRTVALANAAYKANGALQTVVLPAGSACRSDGTVTIGSGVVVEGPGTIVVPNQTVATLVFQDADFSGVENLTIKILAGPGGNNAALSTIWWRDTPNDAAAHLHFFARNNTVIDGSWGIFVASEFGSGSMQDVDISNNTVMSSVAYTNADGIHVNGNVHGITITGNRIMNRHDAAIGLSSGPGILRTLSGAVVSNNVCLNDLAGLDNSGASNVLWNNNYVQATAPIANVSNPAARSIAYVGITPVNVKFIGNYLQNYQGTGTDVTAKVDDTGSNLATNVEWASNTFVGKAAMWLAANTVVIHDNYFSPGASITLEYDAHNRYPGQNMTIGVNYWTGDGAVSAPGDPSLYVNNSLARQHTNGKMTITGAGNFRTLP